MRTEIYVVVPNAHRRTGDTMGGIGSAIALKRGSFTQKSDGTFTGTIIAQPDRGFNVYVFLLLALQAT